VSEIEALRDREIETRLSTREKILSVETAMLNSPDRVEIPPHVNHFADGMYARELFMPAGMIISSKIHITNHFCFVLKGKAQVVDEHKGGQVIEAPCMIKTLAGTKRVLKILEDSLWITVHATEETDVDEIEKQIIATDFPDLLEGVTT